LEFASLAATECGTSQIREPEVAVHDGQKDESQVSAMI
jgi:hypothetical protein